MVTGSQKPQKTLYEKDYNLWVLETIKKLENKDFNAVDWDNSLKKLSNLIRREKRKLESLLIRLVDYILKLKYWESEIKKELKASPSLKPYLFEIWNECYQDGREIAGARSHLPLHTFPEQPIATLEEILNL